MNLKSLAVAVLAALPIACSHQPAADDPLRNTKKLVAEGHASLYRNGAFEVPATTIKLIPPGPGAQELALEMAGMRAAQSFQLSLKHARESVEFGKRGISGSARAARTIRSKTLSIADSMREVTSLGTASMLKGPGLVGDVTRESIALAGEAAQATARKGAALSADTVHAGAEISTKSGQAAGQVLDRSLDAAGETLRDSSASARKHAAWAGDRFVRGYAAVPAELGKRAEAVSESASLQSFVTGFQRSNAWRDEVSGQFSDLVVDSAGSYSKDVGAAFQQAATELHTGADSGYTLAALRSLRWVLQGVFWDGMVKPAGKFTAGAIGYIATNTVAFPVMLVAHEGVVVAKVAVEVTWNAAGAAYDITAPTAAAALAGLYSAVELVGGSVVAGAEAVGGGVASTGLYAGGKFVGGAVAGGGYLAGKGVQYVGAPLAAAGVSVGGTAVGVVVGGGATAVGAGLVVVGAGGEAVTQVAGHAAAGATLAGGTVASVGAATALGTYELAKAVVVPAGYELGAGLVLSYGTITQLSAQAALAVADASYLVLSLEGPNWVVYAVRGNLGKGDDLPTGAVLDLKGMQQAGETLYRVPVSDEELRRVVDSVQHELPTMPSREAR